MTPRTLDEALAMVPEYVMLRPGVDVPRKGADEIRVESRREWLPVEDMLWDFERAYEHHVIARRPVPQHVREALAKMVIEPTNDDEYEVGRWLAGVNNERHTDKRAGSAAGADHSGD